MHGAQGKKKKFKFREIVGLSEWSCPPWFRLAFLLGSPAPLALHGWKEERGKDLQPRAESQRAESQRDEMSLVCPEGAAFFFF